MLATLPAVARSEPITREWVSKWESDLAFAADSLPRAHPNFFHAVSREAYRASLDSLRTRLPRLADHEVVVELARIVARVGDGHTRVTFPFDSSAGFFTGHSRTAAPRIPGLVFRHYPIRFGLFADTLFVVRADSAHRELLGGRLVSLGHRSAADAVAAVEPTIQRDNDNQVRDLLPNWLVCPEILEARGVVADRERAPIVVERADGKRVTGELTPVPPGRAVSWLDVRDGGTPPLRDRYPRRKHWFIRLPGTRIVYARYREVSNDPDQTVAQFVDTLFATIEASRAERLVLDVRGNVGGDGTLNRTLVQRLIRAERLWEPGGLWVLVDRGTFSAAVMLAADLESRSPAVLCGEKTGGHPNSYGDSRRIVLPASGITVRVSSLYWQLTGPQDERDGITPHVPIETRFDEWRSHRDPALEAAVAPAAAATPWPGSWSGEIGWSFQRLPVRLELHQRDTQWGGRVTLEAAGIESAPLTRARLSQNTIVAWWGEGEWALRGRLQGKRLIGVVRYDGLDHPVVLERASTERAGP